MEIESSATLYALSIKGGYYDHLGEIVEDLTEAKLFPTREEAIKFREFYDPCHHVEQAILLRVTIFIAQED
jgi:hypothetical protein